jgi:hypothetical protein
MKRLMVTFVGDILSQEALPEGLVNKGLDVLRKLSENERDMIRVVVEIVSELRDVLIKDGDVPVSLSITCLRLYGQLTCLDLVP